MDFLKLNYRKGRALAVVAVLILLGGCAGQVNMNEVLSAKTEIQSNQGIVVARVINASSYPLPFNQLTITPEDVNQSDKIKPERLLALHSGETETSIFASPIKAGNYALDSIRAFHIRGEFMYSRFVGADEKFGLFTVKPGQITDLGTLIYYPKPQGEKYIDVLLRTDEAFPGAVLKTHFPFYQYDQDNILGWHEDGKSEERDDLMVSVAQNPVVFRDRYLAPDNSVYLLGQLGVMVKRTADGEYELDAVDTNLTLNSIVQSSNGDLAVGGKEGKLFLKKAGHDEWQDISLDNNVEIEELLIHQERYLDVILKTQRQVKVLRADFTLSDITFEQVNEYTFKNDWTHSDREKPDPQHQKPRKNRDIAGVLLIQRDKQSALKITTRNTSYGGIFSPTKDKTFVFNPENWRIQSLLVDEKIDYELEAGAVKLGIKKAGYWSWSGLPTYWRLDKQSDSWQEITTEIFRCPDGTLITDEGCAPATGGQKPGKMDSFSLTSIPWFRNETEALAIVTFSDRNFWTGESSSETKIIRTRDGGKSWKDTGNTLPKDYCSSVLTEISEAFVLFCAGATSDFYESMDEGKNWEHKRQQENF